MLSIHDDEAPFKQLDKYIIDRDGFDLLSMAEDVRKHVSFSVAIMLEKDGG